MKTCSDWVDLPSVHACNSQTIWICEKCQPALTGLRSNATLRSAGSIDSQNVERFDVMEELAE